MAVTRGGTRVKTEQRIVATRGVAGGRPRLAGHRIRVQDVAMWHERQRMSPDEIADQFDLTLGEVHAALAYYFDHIKDIRRDIERDREIVAASKKRHPSKLQAKLKTPRG
ncbi:MAG: DUF433 domain-containing protein [Chloroflexi bacterium]|nr:DUF433 domain-containing protein [Chloroflexota bacterium]